MLSAAQLFGWLSIVCPLFPTDCAKTTSKIGSIYLQFEYQPSKRPAIRLLLRAILSFGRKVKYNSCKSAANSTSAIPQFRW